MIAFQDTIEIDTNGEGQIRGKILPAWTHPWAVLGGYLGALSLCATRKHVDRSLMPVAIASQFISPAHVGDLQGQVEVVRAGRASAHLIVRLEQDEAPILVSAITFSREAKAEIVRCQPALPPVPDFEHSLQLPEWPFPELLHPRVATADPEKWEADPSLSVQEWFRYLAPVKTEDPTLGAAALLPLLDLAMFFAAAPLNARPGPPFRRSNYRSDPYLFSTLWMQIQFGAPGFGEPEYLITSDAVSAAGDSMAVDARVWGAGERFLASAQQHFLVRAIPAFS